MDKDNILIKIINYVKAKVPVALITINTIIVKYCYDDCM